ncbi:DUF3870 domain-containing protein [Sporosarcina soli]|uniref:DUF3870 domain-containing protein n=1 Tax=Sporosarcina soli TaxID=334736 RepID=A0ABW0THL9_9BACL
MSRKNENTDVLLAGFAQLPKGTPLFETQKVIGCILVIDSETDVIKKATFTFIQDLTNEFSSSLILGYSIVEEIDEIIKNMENKLMIPPQKAAIQAVISGRNRYLEMKK